VNTYHALSDYGRAIFGEDVFEGDFETAEERDHLDGGHLEIVPRPYRVLSDNYQAPKGETVELALPMETEDALLGVHIERVDKPTPATMKD
jgi:hypothetical protein